MGIALRDIETQISVLIEMIDVQLFIQGDVNAADAFLNQTMELLRAYPSNRWRAVALTKQGQAAHARGNLKNAVELYNQALPMLDRLGMGHDRDQIQKMINAIKQ